jgi:hypothetical protein
MKSSFHNLIHFFPLVCNCRLSSIQSQSHFATDSQSVLVSSPVWGSWPDMYSWLKVTVVCSQAHIPASRRLETRLFSTELFFIATSHRPHREHSVLTALLYSNGSFSIVAARMCLRSRCPTTQVYSVFTITAFGRHIQYEVIGQYVMHS